MRQEIEVNIFNTSVIKNKFAEVESTVDGFVQTFTSEYDNSDTVTSKIEQLANAINLELDQKVGEDEVISKINLSTEGIYLQGNLINFNNLLCISSDRDSDIPQFYLSPTYGLIIAEEAPTSDAEVLLMDAYNSRVTSDGFDVYVGNERLSHFGEEIDLGGNDTNGNKVIKIAQNYLYMGSTELMPGVYTNSPSPTNDSEEDPDIEEETPSTQQGSTGLLLSAGDSSEGEDEDDPDEEEIVEASLPVFYAYAGAAAYKSGVNESVVGNHYNGYFLVSVDDECHPRYQLCDIIYGADGTPVDDSNVGAYSLSVGQGLAGGDYAVATGKGVASGLMSFAHGMAKADGAYSAAVGTGVEAYAPYEFVVGTYNKFETYTVDEEDEQGHIIPGPEEPDPEDGNRLFVVGNGEADNKRANAFEVLKTGRVIVAGNLEIGGVLSSEEFPYVTASDMASRVVWNTTLVDTNAQLETNVYRWGRVVTIFGSFTAKVAIQNGVNYNIATGFPKASIRGQFPAMNVTKSALVNLSIGGNGALNRWYAGSIAAGDFVRFSYTYICQKNG